MRSTAKSTSCIATACACASSATGSRSRAAAVAHGRGRGAAPPAITALKLQVAVSYGGRWDIAAGRAASSRRSAPAARCAPRTSTSAFRARSSRSPDVPDPDLFIRTGGEQRISNFLLWNLAYTELYFCDTLWPDFDAAAVRSGARFIRGARTALRPDAPSRLREAAIAVLRQRVLTAVVLVAVLLGVMLGLPPIATVWLSPCWC